MIDFAHAISVKVHPYRTKFAVWFMTIGDHKSHELQRYLASLAGVMPDNHTTYEVEFEGGQIMFFTASDGTIYVGSQVRDF